MGIGKTMVMLIQVGPFFQAGDKLHLVSRTSDFYGDDRSPESADELVVPASLEVDVTGEAGRYWLAGEDGRVLAVDLPTGHAGRTKADREPSVTGVRSKSPRKPAKKRAAKKAPVAPPKQTVVRGAISTADTPTPAAGKK